MRYKLMIVIGVALAAVLALAVLRLGTTGSTSKGGGVTESNLVQHTGPVLSCPVFMAHACGSKGLFPTAPSHPGGNARVHWVATS